MNPTTPTTLDAATLEKLIAAASAAPSIHNTQPWRYRLDPETVTLEMRAAADRELRHADPHARALHLSVGAALFNIRIATAHFGWEPVVRLLPDPARPDVLAAVRLAGSAPCPDAHPAALYDAVWRRHSSRFPFTGARLPDVLCAELLAAAVAEGTRLRFPEPEENARLLGLTAEAEQRDHTDPERRTESRAWIRPGGVDGVPPSALGPRDARGRMPVRDFSGLLPGVGPAPEAFEAQPCLAVLSTSGDAAADWLRAGQALERVLLVATAERAVASLLHQALEWHDLRWALRDAHSGPGHVQMLIRLGYGPQGPATPRRAVRDVLDDA
ncbi:hypothetical protein ABZ832_17700 [Streptantibioticus parmotrematis]|uniref:Acg family FMN-binding oxidoreductase n=1 Tax=Streptantibioticus parmotrematis TaxID=2873249 RepID=UPI0033D2D1A4